MGGPFGKFRLSTEQFRLWIHGFALRLLIERGGRWLNAQKVVNRESAPVNFAPH